MASLAPQGSMASRAALTNYIHNYWMLFTHTILPGHKPGFPHALKLGFNTMDTDRMSFGDMSTNDTLIYRYQLSDDVPKFTTGLLNAVMDELTTISYFRVGQPGRPGLSVQMQTELVDTNLDQYQELEFVNTVTKMGRMVSHTRTDIVCPESEIVVAYSSHVKYMPLADKNMDQLLQNKEMFDKYVEEKIGDKVPKAYEEKPLLDQVILPYLDYLDHGRATFQINVEHTNPVSMMHGGCASLVMEEVASRFAQTELGSSVVNEAMQVEFLDGAQGEVSVNCETVGQEDDTLHVRVLIESGDRICSEGKLRLSATSE